MASYNIGQLRRNEISSYSTDVSYTQELAVNEDSIIDFYDQCLNLGTKNVSSVYSYYLKFKVQHREDSVQNFTIKLKNTELETDNVQSVREFTVKLGSSSEWDTYEIIFNPNSNYNEIIFELSRLALDFNMDNGDSTSGRIMVIEILDFCLVTNVISSYLSNKYSGLTTLKKIGIQGPPGLIFTLNGEEMKIGRRGIYELYYDGITISYIGFVIKDSSFTQDGKDYFIMDFKY